MSVQPATPLTDSLAALVEEYQRWLAVERSLAPVTVSYRAAWLGGSCPSAVTRT